MNNDFKSTGERPEVGTVPESMLTHAVKRSDSGQLSVAIGDISKTPSFKRDLGTLTRIRQLSQIASSRR